MTRRVLLVSYEAPGLGGAATSAYALFWKMQRDGIDAHFVNLISEVDLPYVEYVLGRRYDNPKGLPNVWSCVLKDPLYRRHEPLARLVDGIAPSVAVASGDIATVLLKRAAPEVLVVFVAGGSEQVGHRLALGRAPAGVAGLGPRPRTVRAPAVVYGRESAAAAAADLIVAASDLTRALFDHSFPFWHTCKLFPETIWKAEWIGEAAAAEGASSRPFDERTLDLLFVASSWSRAEKNLRMVRRVAARCPGLRIGIVGESDAPVAGATPYGFIGDARRVLALMGDAKAVVCPSLFDASPGVLFQASIMGCNVVASRNCGNWMICHDDLLVEPFGEDGFVEAVGRAVGKKYPDNMRYFLERRSYARLLEVLAVL